MNAPAALLYGHDLAWQSPRVDQELPPVTTPVPKEAATPAVGPSTLRRVLEANGISALVVFGAAIWVVTSVGKIETAVAELKVRVDNLEKGVDAVKTRLNVLSGGEEGVLPAPTGAPSALPAPLGTVAPIETNPRPNTPRPVTEQVRPVGTVLPQVCVSRRTKTRFACERAVNCLPKAKIDRSFYAELQGYVGENEILLCDERP